MSKASLAREYPASKEHNAILIMSTAALHNQVLLYCWVGMSIPGFPVNMS